MDSENPSESIIIPDSWSQAIDSIAYDSVTSPPPIAFICGPKNCGKTVFSRILLNTFLHRYKRVAYLDTDVGQPEFTPPACLSLNVINKQTPDLTIACLKTPVRSIFFGDVSSKRDPTTYIDNIFMLYDYFRKEYYQCNESDTKGKAQLPLIINTPGWVKGNGYDALVKMLRYMAPTHVVQIRISAEAKNLPTGVFWLDDNQEVSVNLIELDSARRDKNNKSILKRKDASHVRDLRVFAYFRQCLPRDFNVDSFKELGQALASQTPYVVPISKIKVKHLHCQVPSSELFHSLNATIVGLAVSSSKSTDSEDGVPWCIGLGIVRGIDISKGIYYVLTPVSPRNLERVDLFLQGFLRIPTRLLQIQGYMSPYVSGNVLNC